MRNHCVPTPPRCLKPRRLLATAAKRIAIAAYAQHKHIASLSQAQRKRNAGGLQAQRSGIRSVTHADHKRNAIASARRAQRTRGGDSRGVRSGCGSGGDSLSGGRGSCHKRSSAAFAVNGRSMAAAASNRKQQPFWLTPVRVVTSVGHKYPLAPPAPRTPTFRALPPGDAV